MGADTFMVTADGNTAKQAFDDAVDDALYEYGHGGYTGTIAEKDSYLHISLPQGLRKNPPLEKITAYAEDLIEKCDSRIDDKWGPAGCLLVKQGADGEPNTYLFFGWASS